MDYKEAYEKEHIKNAELAGRIADLEASNEELQFKLDRIKKNPLWKISKPFRSMMHWGIRQVRRVANCGGPKGIAAKMAYKKRERAAMKQFGTASFPTPEQAALERETVFDRPVRISILVPLYNTPDGFLREMLDSVLAQTYENWELCLADGSDAEHAYVGDICREYIEKDRLYLAAKEYVTNVSEVPESRIIYRKLAKNGGIAENTNACYEMATGEYVGLFDHDDILHPSALFAYVKAINEQGADYIYCDETTFKNGDINRMLTMHFKPDYAPDNLRANNYICHFSVFAKSLMEGTELFRTKFNGSQDHDMILRLTDRAEKIVHIPR
ncbi:MAG: glycosyltransferase, partial [Lachnospiraceae bacterium]|nr:glycosyltransferase [Lachnospiraceae bacterium]